MRVVVDARPALDPRRTGVGIYSEGLLRNLPAALPEDEIVAWYLHAKGAFSRRRFFTNGILERPSRFPARVFGPLSWRLGVPKVEWLAGDFDLLFATNFLPPATAHADRVVMVVHDLAFERLPATAPHHDARWRRRFADALDTAAGIIVPSGSTRDDLLDGHGVDPSKIHVVHHGVSSPDGRPSAREIADVMARFGVPERYVLFVGGIEPRKNLQRLARAFTRVETDAALVIAGGPVRWIPQAAARLSETIDALGEGRRIIRTGYVSSPEKASLLHGATVLAYPSLYEGFGFPVLEAFVADVPVLTSNTSSLPEVVGDAAMTVDPASEEEIAAGLARLLRDDELRARLREAGRKRVGSFTWEACARSTAEALKGAMAAVAHG